MNAEPDTAQLAWLPTLRPDPDEAGGMTLKAGGARR